MNARKFINFDLDTKALKEFYPGKDYRAAYSKIKVFMENNGFEHKQSSGYISIKPMKESQINKIILRMVHQFPWLSKCVNRFDVTTIWSIRLKDISAREDTFEAAKPPIQDTQSDSGVLSRIRSTLDESDR